VIISTTEAVSTRGQKAPAGEEAVGE